MLLCVPLGDIAIPPPKEVATDGASLRSSRAEGAAVRILGVGLSCCLVITEAWWTCAEVSLLPRDFFILLNISYVFARYNQSAIATMSIVCLITLLLLLIGIAALVNQSRWKMGFTTIKVLLLCQRAEGEGVEHAEMNEIL